MAVHGCGGVGLSAIMIAAAAGAQVIGVDINPDALALARTVGAQATVNAREVDDVPRAIHAITGGGAHLSVDALGSTITCVNSIRSLRKRGRHVQVGLMAAEQSAPPIPMGIVIGNELEILGSHGMQAHRYPHVLDLIVAGKLEPQLLIQQRVTLVEGAEILEHMGEFNTTGVAVIDRF